MSENVKDLMKSLNQKQDEKIDYSLKDVVKSQPQLNHKEYELNRRKEILDHELMLLSISKLKLELTKDKSEGSYYHSWQANIAMAFVDEYQKVMNPNMDHIVSDEIKTVCNNAAKRFLDQLIGEL